MRRAIADFEVLGPGAEDRSWLCRAPRRLGMDDPVMVTELALASADLPSAADQALRWSAVAGEGALRFIEMGPDPDGAGAYLVSEALPEGTFLGRPPLQVGEVAAAGATVARTAHQLHEAGVAHGHISPATVARLGRGIVLLPPPLDFPAGKVTGASDWRVLVTVDPVVLGGERPGRSSDIWSIGVLLHLMASSRAPFPGIEDDQPVTAVQRMIFSRPEPDPDIHPALLGVITRCLDLRRSGPRGEGRFETAADLADALGEFS